MRTTNKFQCGAQSFAEYLPDFMQTIAVKMVVVCAHIYQFLLVFVGF
jgi:hypothetical protein